MKVATTEKAFLLVGGIALVGCMLALTWGTLAMGIHLPGRVAEVDPQTVRATPPFDRPGVRQVGPNRYEAVVIGQAWAFIPSEIRVPVGAEVTFIGTTADVIHGFHIETTRVNMMLIPGQVSRTTYRFERPGEYALICHEYCGLGHHTMFGKVIAE
jgi:cytochrome c oxidase subunit 2